MNELYDVEQRRKEFAGQEADFIRTEIALALTFLDVANTTAMADTRTRNIGNAQKAHDEAAIRIDHHSYETEQERQEVKAALLVLTQRLQAMA